MEEITAWWESVHQIMEKRDANIPVVCLGDFNAKLGSAVSEGCGDHAWDVEDDSGGLLRELVDRWGLLMPSTFSQYQTMKDTQQPLSPHWVTKAALITS